MLEKRLYDFLRVCLPPASEVPLTPDLSLRADLGIDSAQILLLLFRFEQEFHVELPGTAFPNGAMTTVGQLVERAREVLAEAGHV